ncbi:SDR family oxidoreductase [Paenibacillus sp. N1-5-1-14]|uniref:SDR family oxidoreductase n=1 Tax=Paenibacillus radicibacter TaxID=2972488 RepID=UPI002158EAFD|nr:SDR family oxidoreductase [Paenibacillus radicibacter]MCR8643771.1 SDR family oxidoreductase [Paenibacillus radicibacter]
MSIAITGATGQLGAHIIQQLLGTVGAGSIVACVRDVGKAQKYVNLGIEVRYCDYDSSDSLAQAFVGITKLLLISSSHHDDTIRLRQHAQVIEAAKNANVEHILYTSFAFLGKGYIAPSHLHLATEHAILTTGIAYTFLRNALYMDFVHVFGLDEAITSGELHIYPGDWKFNSVTREDLAEGIATVLSESGHTNKTYELTASSPWTFQDLSDVLTDLTGKPIAVRQNPLIQSWIYGFLKHIDAASTSNDLENLLGRPTTSLRESIRNWIVMP